MISWNLWRRLRTPFVTHPIYKRVITSAAVLSPWYLTCVMVLIGPALIVPGVVFMSAAYGLNWSVQIALQIARQREIGLYDLIAVAPPGLFGMSQAITSACLHRNGSLEQMQSFGAWMLRGFFAVVLLMLGNSLNPAAAQSDPYELVTILLSVVTLIVAVYIDHVQSLVVAVLVGMLVPSYVEKRIEAGVAAFFTYALLQIMTYVIAIITGFSALPTILEGLRLPALVMVIALPLLRLLLFALIREVIIGYLWSLLVRETNPDPSQAPVMTG